MSINNYIRVSLLHVAAWAAIFLALVGGSLVLDPEQALEVIVGGALMLAAAASWLFILLTIRKHPVPGWYQTVSLLAISFIVMLLVWSNSATIAL